MKPLDAPAFGATEVLAALGTGPRINRVTAVSASILEGEAEYLDKADVDALWSLTVVHPGIDGPTGEDICYAYEAKLVDKEGPARAFYNSLRTTPYNRCPLCLERDIGALDHFLPKERWPHLAIVPANLVPICTACNGKKSSRWAATSDRQYLHPYFDDLGSDEWLMARLNEAPGAPLSFEVVRSSHWDAELHGRALLHFERFDLAELYSDHAATLLAGYVGQLEEILALSGPGAVRELMLGTARSFKRAAIDLWSARAMQTWGESDWFCAGGWVT